MTSRFEVISVCWHVIVVPDGDRFTVIVGETAIASFATADEADNVCIQLAMYYRAVPLTIGHVPATVLPPAERAP